MSAADVRRVVIAFRRVWQGDPELVTDKDWQAWTRLAKEVAPEELEES